MAGNSDFILVRERSWRRGLGNLLDNEFSHWWKTSLWWIQCLIWGGITGLMLAGVIFGSGDISLTDAVMIYSIFAGLFPAVGVVIIMQDALVGEKQDGTAAWVLSKPVARPAFILAKVIANSLGVLVTMVAVPALLAYPLLSIAGKAALPPLGFLAGLGVISLSLFFYLTLTLMLGAVFSGRGPVIGGALALVFLQQYAIGLLPLLRNILPWTLVVPLNNQKDALAPALILGQPVSSYWPILLIFLEALLFVAIAFRRFEREEL